MKRVMKSGICTLLAVLMLLAPLSGLAAGTVKILKVNVSGARLRKGPGDYEVIATLPKGEKVFYLDKTVGAYCLVFTASGVKGYVYKGFLDEYGACKKSAVAYVSGKSLTVYKKASTSAGRVTTLSRHSFVIIYKTSDSWAYVRTLSGRGGYVKLSGLKKVS